MPNRDATIIERRGLHRLASRCLTDIPGRWESWKEYVQYLGHSQWRLIVDGTTFDGRHPGHVSREVVSASRLVSWVTERDHEEAEHPPLLDGPSVSASEPEGSENATAVQQAPEGSSTRRTLGERAARLLAIAQQVGAVHTVKCLQGYEAGTWPKSRVPRVLTIKGLASRGVWMHVSHTVIDVETSDGPGYLYPPNSDRFARLALKAGSSHFEGVLVRLTAEQAKKATALLSQLSATQ